MAPPDQSGLLEPAARTDAAREWATWWTTLVECESRRHFDTGDQDISATDERFLEYHRAVHPDTSAALADTVLQAPAAALFDEGCDWAGTLTADIQGPQNLASRPQAFTWVVVRDTVEAVAVTCGVDVGALDGAASVLRVEGDWWDLVAPGFALCSSTAATNSNIVVAILRSVFESRLTPA